MLASTFFDPVLGIDLHIVLVPAPGPVPTPVPLPFVGMVFDPAGMVVGMAISAALGGGPGLVLVNELPATNCGTEATNLLTMPHLPAPGVAFARGLPGNDAELYFGSLDVSFAGSLAVRLGDLALSCSDPIRLPTSVVLALPKGWPVLVIRPPVPDVAAMAMAAAFRVGMRALRGIARAGGRLFRFLRRAQHASPRWSRFSSRIHGWVDNIAPRRARARIHRGVCHLTGHPVDVATGRVLTDFLDFELPGPIPLRFERHYDSSLSWRDGVLGHGWSHTLDQAVWRERGKVIYRAEDGREIEFHVDDRPGRTLRPGSEACYLAPEGLTLRCLDGGRWEICDSNGITHEFAPVEGASPDLAKLVGKRDRGGHRIELSYDLRGLLDTVRDTGGRLVRFEHDHDGRLIAIKLPLSRGHGWFTYRKFRYDEHGDLVRATDSLGHEWTFDYVTHLLVQETDRLGLSFYFQYDGLGSGAKCIRTWGDDGIFDHVVSYDVANNKTIVEDSLGGVTVYDMDDLGHVVAVTDPVGARTELEYDPDCGKVTLERSPSGAETRKTYDVRGNLTRLVGPDGAVTQITWHSRLDLPIAVVDPTGATWLFRYDHNGNLEERQSPVGGLTFYEWKAGLLVRVRDPSGGETVLEYDEHKSLCRVVLPNGGEIKYWHNGRGEVTKVRDAAGAVTEIRRDTEGRPVQRLSALGLTLAVTYDAEGNIARTQDANRDLRYRYGRHHQVVERWDADSRVGLAYDTECRLIEVTNEAGERHRYQLDRGGRVREEIGFDGARRVYLRDVEGRVTSTISASDRRTSSTYDVAGRLTELKHSDGTGASFEYDLRGLLTRALNEAADVRFERDPLGRVVAESQDGGEVWVRSRYGARGERSSLSSDLGARQEIEVDALGDIAALIHRGAFADGGAVSRVAFERNAVGDELVRELPGGVSIGWRRDKTGRPLERHTTRRQGAQDAAPALADVLDVRSYQWRGEDQIAAIINANAGPTFYDHDTRGRLIRERRPDATVERAMDGVGNVYRASDASDRSFGVGGRLERADGTSYGYDADGNQTERLEPDGARWEQRWNDAGMLAEVVRPDGDRVRFGYDAFSRRTSKQLMTVAEDGTESVVAETRFIWDQHTVLHELSSEHPPTTWYWEPRSFTPILKDVGGKRETIASDHLGTPTEMYDELGQLTWSMQLDVFGVARFGVGDGADCPFRWPGQYEDQETGLYYNRHRYYDAETGVYLRQDPIGLAGGLRPYGYVEDPAGWIDAFGLAKTCAAGELPSLRGRSVPHIERILRLAGFIRTKISSSSARNQTWRHVDGSEVRIHPYGNVATTPYRSGNNAHVHRQSPGGAQLTDRGTPSANPAETHIGIRNPSDLPLVRGRPHGA